MKRDYRGFLIIHALLGALLLATPVGAIAAPHGSPDGGDVLKPGKRSAPSQKDGMRILLGPDAGATWASFTNGPANFALTNPYISQTYAETNHQYFLRFLNFTANKGDGWGLAIGGAADFLFTRVFGISAKLGYHTRHGNFSQDVYSTVFAPGMTAHLRDAVDAIITKRIGRSTSSTSISCCALPSPHAIHTRAAGSIPSTSSRAPRSTS